MYAVGVISDDNTVASAEGAGVYLFQNCANGGWGASGAGAKSLWEPMGQEWGRWFVPLPYGVVGLQQATSVAQYQGRLYLLGGYSYNLVLDEQYRLWKQGIQAPAEYPEVTGGGVAAGSYAYFSWYDEHTGERSPLSKGFEIGTSTPRTWKNLPVRPPDDVYAGDDTISFSPSTIHGSQWDEAAGSNGNRLYLMRGGDKITNDIANPRYVQVGHMAPRLFEPGGAGAPASAVIVPVTRATHLELWLSLDSDLPRLAMRVAIGTTEVTESTTVDQLGESFITSFQRFPRCRFNVIYHDRQVMAGDEEHPDTVYLSSLFYPERWEGMSFKVRDGQVITGLCAMRDYCLVFTRNSMYILQGYTDADYQIMLVDQSLGSVGHNCNVVMHGNPYIWTEKGPYMYNGAWHPISPENQWVPVSDIFVSNEFDSRDEIAQLMQATDDPQNNCYIVSNAQAASIGLHTPWIEPTLTDRRFYAVVDYTLVQPEAGGAMQPARVSFDTKIGSQTSAGTEYMVGAYSNRYEFMKYLRNRWGMGNLYHFGAWWPSATDDFGRYASFCAIGSDNGPYVSEERYGGSPRLATTLWNTPDATSWPYLIRQPSRIVTGFYYFDLPDAYIMESKTFKRFWFHMRNFTDSRNWAKVYVAPDSGYWNKRFHAGDGLNPEGDVPIEWPTGVGQGYGLDYPSFTHSSASYSARKDPDQGIGDIILPILPDGLAGRGLWLDIYGYDLQFHGFGTQFQLGTDSTLWVPLDVPS